MAVLKMLFVTDVHGSETCFRKFLNALKIYKADVGILMGDLCGKMLNPIVKQSDGNYHCNVLGQHRVLTTQEELQQNEKNIASMGNYYFYTDPDEMEMLKKEGKSIEGRVDERAAHISLSEGKIDDLFRKAVVERLTGWMELADERMKGSGIDIFMAAGNDDLKEVDEVIDKGEYIVNADDKKVMVKDYEMVTLSWSNKTPWDTEREYPEEEIEKKLESLAGQITNIETSIFNLHVPPNDTLIDQCPKLSENLVPSTDETISAGSTAVKEAIKKYQPMLGLHGHIHESKGVVKIGRTTCLNPGSEYSEGIMDGVIITLKKKKLKNYHFVSG
jgi:Icc-related predicted phosphoesterase